jgi:hypothetical protein
MKTVEEIAIEVTEVLARLDKLEASNKMIRNVETRLLKLEAAQIPPVHTWRRVIGDSDAECEAQRRAMIENGQAAETDKFIFRIIVDPPAGTTPGIGDFNRPLRYPPSGVA